VAKRYAARSAGERRVERACGNRRRATPGNVLPVRDAGEGAEVPGLSAFERVICGVDGSREGLEAVRQARKLALPDSELFLVSVSESHLAVHTGFAAAEWAERLRRDAESALEQAATVAERARTLLLEGRAAESLLRTVAEEHATLVAVGSHEIARGAGMLIGSVATRLVHEAPCSVLIARAPSDGAAWPQSIVVGVDGSPSSLAAAAVGREIGDRLRARVRFVVGRGAGAADLAPEELENCELDLTFSDAKPVPALIRAAGRSDLLVVGSRGLSGVRALGSVSERVAHQATCSLLVVRARTG
jgi:nucleotide-binding universal stress UspA family protein